MYSTQLKLEIVQRYLQGNISVKQLAEEYHVHKGDIQKWRDVYLEHGIDGLNVKPKTYTGDFKISVVEYMHHTGSSLRKTAAHFNIPCRDLIKKWEQIYYKEGKEALYIEKRGRASKMKIKKRCNPKKKTKDNEDLLAEVKYLCMENEYLKKLNALIQNREKLDKPIK